MGHRLILVAAATALSLCSCGKKADSELNANADTGLTADAIGSNDVTAIDAVTGEAANMAADVAFAPANNATVGNGSSASGDSNSAAPSKPRPSRPTTSDEAAPPPVTSEPAQPSGNNSTE